MRKAKFPTGAKYRKLRERMELTQGEVADKLGFSSPQFISNIERGIAKMPVPLIPQLSEIYQVSQTVLIQMAVATYRTELNRKLISK